jgi:hypothetical protein
MSMVFMEVHRLVRRDWGQMRNIHKILLECPQRTEHFVDLGVHERIVMKLVVEK